MGNKTVDMLIFQTAKTGLCIHKFRQDGSHMAKGPIKKAHLQNPCPSDSQAHGLHAERPNRAQG